MSSPLLTAIIFAFHHEARIARCIESILFQKTDYPFILHIYDDCSQDDTGKVCAEYAEKYPEKIKFFPQKENTFLKPYPETQGYKAMQDFDTKYFCIIEGDDHWCNENKIQMALDFLENNPDYSGFAHDTMQVNEKTGTSESWVHDIAKYGQIENPVCFDERFLFFMTSSRIFRNYGFKDLKVWAVDYIVYSYHIEKGPIYYHDEVMAVYYMGNKGVVAPYNEKMNNITSMYAYRINKMFDFKHDELCTKSQRENAYEQPPNPKKIRAYKRLLWFKKLLGVKLGWHVWFFVHFVPTYGLECMDLNYIFSRKFIKDNSNKVIAAEQKNKAQSKS